VIGGIGGSGRRNLHQNLQDEGPEDGFGTEDFAARALAQIFFSDSNESLGAASNHQRGSRNPYPPDALAFR